MTSFGDSLKKLRAERGVSISLLSASIGVNRSSIYRWEHGKSFPKSVEIISLISDYFKVSPEYFFNASIIDMQQQIQQLRDEVNNLRHSVYRLQHDN